ncbi:uncharacterized protein (DUF2384 family) [Microbacterium sp. AK009]|uniref:hypothetical protein n=1 Tax=Microbacterium sp. AK009 TaxID=2723068 RepID=UPI0015CCF09F|nr:hypothetical protein [Microbacterium sp. AK009]NYF15985.1 uncharacterized protein (DUF2384 family) [Microbacterium sp. AK009]
MTGLSDAERRFAIAAGVPAEAFTRAGRREAELRRAQLNAADTVPDLDLRTVDHRVVSAFPSGTNRRDKIFVLFNPMEELDNMSPIDWLAAGQSVDLLVELIGELDVC